MTKNIHYNELRYIKVYEIDITGSIEGSVLRGFASNQFAICEFFCWFSPSSEGFSPGTPVSLTPEIKPTFLNSNSKIALAKNFLLT